MMEQEDTGWKGQAQGLVKETVWSTRLCWRSGEHPECSTKDSCPSEHIMLLCMQIGITKPQEILDKKKNKKHSLWGKKEVPATYTSAKNPPSLQEGEGGAKEKLDLVTRR